MSGRKRGLRGGLPAAAMTIMLAACQTTVTTSDGRAPAPEPRTAPTTPIASQPNAMAMQVGVKAVDTNGNGYPDTVPVEVYLFAEPYPMPMHGSGTFDFTMIGIGAERPLATWRFEPADVDGSRLMSPLFGRGFGFGLNLLHVGSDVMPLTAVNVSCRFEPADGSAAVTSEGIHCVQVGKR